MIGDITIIIIVLFCKGGFTKDVTSLDVEMAEAALNFSHKWMTTPKSYMVLVLPTSHPFNTNNLVRLAKKVSMQNNTYFIFSRKVPKQKNLRIRKKSLPNPQNDLVWFLFEASYYEITCSDINVLFWNVTIQNNFLFFVKNQNMVDFYFNSCKIRFDSNIVVYYPDNMTENLSAVKFEEMFKIDPDRQTLNKNILGVANLHTKEMTFSGLTSFIWKRRGNLHEKAFTGISEIYEPGITDIIKSKDMSGNIVLNPIGYCSDLMSQLSLTLNFTIKTNLPAKRNNWTYLVETVQKGQYDIGYTLFTHTHYRIDKVDFLFGITPIWFELYYAKHTNGVRIKVFTGSFHLKAWLFLLAYATALVTGFVALSLIVEIRNETRSVCSIIKEVICILQRATNFVLRSMVGKRMSTEPNWYSTRISFIILVLCGFFIITLYRAFLVAFVAIEMDNPPVQSLKELQGSPHRLAIPTGGVVEALFRTAAPGSEKHTLYNNKKTVPFSFYEEFLDKMVDKENAASRDILFGENLAVRYSKHYPCTLMHIKNYEENNKQITSFILKKNSAFTSFFNYHLLIMKEIGMMDRFYEPYLKNTKKSCPDDQLIRSTIKLPKPVETNTIFFLYVVVLGGMVWAAISLFVEIVYEKYNSKCNV